MRKIKNWYKNLKFRNKVLLSHLLVSMLPVIVLGIFCYIQCRNLLVQREMEMLSETLNQNATVLNGNITLYKNYMNSLIWNHNLQQAINSHYADNVEMYVAYRDVIDPIILNMENMDSAVNLPHFLSWVVLAAVVVNMVNLDGPINQILQIFGMNKINFLGSNTWFRPMIVVTDVWKEFGYNSIVYLAAITAIDPGLHEAAAMDGANWWKRVWHITLPGMLPIILLMGAMNLTSILSAGFDQIYNLYSPMVYQTGDVLDTYVYRVGMISRQYSFSTAVGLLRSVVGMVLMLTANGLAKRFTDRKIF